MISIPDDPRIDTYGQDAGYCHHCEEHLDSGRCVCPRCDDCGDYLNDLETVELTVPHLKTGEPVKIHQCLACSEKRVVGYFESTLENK